LKEVAVLQVMVGGTAVEEGGITLEHLKRGTALHGVVAMVLADSRCGSEWNPAAGSGGSEIVRKCWTSTMMGYWMRSDVLQWFTTITLNFERKVLGLDCPLIFVDGPNEVLCYAARVSKKELAIQTLFSEQMFRWSKRVYSDCAISQPLSLPWPFRST
ncbi:hypothetical protein KCU88_g257, partial [Aureobasidium melanogenum]